MDGQRTKSQEQIFASMHRELRSWNPKIPESADRLDPILRILMQLQASEMARLDQRLSDLWARATSSLIRSLNPECKRWPVPSYTVMRCDVTDPVAEIDLHTRFFYREEREGGQTFFFSPLQTEKLVKAECRYIYLATGNRIIEIPREARESNDDRHGDMLAGKTGQLYLGIEYGGRPSDLSGATVFMRGEKAALRQLRWGHWYPSAASGTFYEDSGFCPGLTSSLDDIVDRTGGTDWGGLRDGRDLFGQLSDSFAIIPEAFARTLEISTLSEEMQDRIQGSGLPLPDPDLPIYWIRVDLPEGGDKSQSTAPLGLFFDCCLVTNRNELTQFKHTGGNRLVEIQIPEPVESILEITSVVDSSGRDYLPRHQLYSDRSAGTYVLEEQKDRLVLWFDYSQEQDLPPDSITVTYALTAGTDANGIGIGKITELYESHPGIDGGSNLIPTIGAIPAKTEAQIVDEVAARLRGRDRALTFPEIARWARSFDERIKQADCRNGIERAKSGVRRCIVVELGIERDDFCSEDEIGLLAERLRHFLKSRAPVNTHFKIETAQR